MNANPSLKAPASQSTRNVIPKYDREDYVPYDPMKAIKSVQLYMHQCSPPVDQPISSGVVGRTKKTVRIANGIRESDVCFDKQERFDGGNYRPGREAIA
eukprot:3526208-Pleurochrysis_carterae.AAC.1